MVCYYIVRNNLVIEIRKTFTIEGVQKYLIETARPKGREYVTQEKFFVIPNGCTMELID